MRWLAAVVLVLLSACVPGGEPPDQAGRRSAPPAGVAPPTELPAVEPPLPSLADFRGQAAQACAEANRAVARAPLQGDPLRPGARRRQVRAAVTHFRAGAAAWTQAAGRLWDFGLPQPAIAERLITSLDTVAQYSHQAAELLRIRDVAGAQDALGALDGALLESDRIARRLGIGPLQDCGKARPRLPRVTRVPVIADDFTFSVGDVRPGPTRFVVRNAGRERHHLFVVRLRDAGSLPDAVRADRDNGRPGRHLRGAGAVSAAVLGGATTTLDARLRRGPYGLVCMLASADGTPHAYKGMATEIMVRG